MPQQFPSYQTHQQLRFEQSLSSIRLFEYWSTTIALSEHLQYFEHVSDVTGDVLDHVIRLNVVPFSVSSQQSAICVFLRQGLHIA